METFTCKILLMTKETAILSIFGANLRKYQNLRGFSQRKMFSLCGIDNAMICRMEGGHINVTLQTLSTLATTLDVSCWELLVTPDDGPGHPQGTTNIST